MRHFLATFLAVLFSYWLIVPAFAASLKPDVPACCRKEGKHHCVMQEAGHVSGFSVTTLREKCPFFQYASVAPHHESNGATPAAAIFAGWTSHPGGSPQTEAAYRISYQRSHQKRGPPSCSVVNQI